MTAAGRKPGPISKKDARRLVDATWEDNGAYRSYSSRLRDAYRTGKWSTPDEGPLSELRRTEESVMQAVTNHANFVRPMIDPLAASQSSRVPDIVFDPAAVTPEALDIAEAQTALTRGAMERDSIEIPLRKMALDRRVVGHGFGQVLWRRVERDLTDAEKDAQWAKAYADFLQRLNEFDEQRQVEASVAGRPEFVFVPSKPTEADLKELEDQLPKTRVVENRVTLQAVDPSDVLLPVDAQDTRSLPWYGIVRYQNLSELRGDEMLDQSAVEKLAPSDMEESSSSKGLKQSSADLVDPRVQVVYLYDVNHHGLTILPLNNGPVLYHGDNPNLFDDVCLVDLPGYRDGSTLRGFGDVEQIAHVAHTISIAEKQQIANLVSSGAMFATWDGVLTDEDKVKIQNYVPGTIIELSRSARDKLAELMGGSIDGPVTPDMIIQAFAVSAPLDADVYNVKQELLTDAQFISGSTPFMQGQMGESGRESGTAAANVQGWSEVRMSADTSAFHLAVQRIATIFFKMTAQYADPDQVMRFVGNNGESWEAIVDGTVFEQGFFTRVKTDATPEGNPALRRQNGREIMNLATELEQVGYNVDGLREQGLRELGIDPRAARLTKQPPQPAMAPGMPQGMPPGMPPGMSPEMGLGELGEMPPELGPAPREMMTGLGGEPTPGDDGTYTI